jgi:hypothetical protein
MRLREKHVIMLYFIDKNKWRKTNENWFKPWGMSACKSAYHSLREKHWFEASKQRLRDNARVLSSVSIDRESAFFHHAPSDITYFPIRFRKLVCYYC